MRTINHHSRARTSAREGHWVAGLATVLLHGLLLAWVLQDGVVPMGNAHRDGSGAGDAIVVEFVAVPRSEPTPASTPVNGAVSASSAIETIDGADGNEASPDPAHASEDLIRESGDLAVRSSTTSAAASAPAHPRASVTASGAGIPTDDLHARYQSALRAAIARTWHSLTGRPFPSGCTLELGQGVGGTVTASSAARCTLSREDRLQLEAAALMAQPLPYAGFEDVFRAEMSLDL